MRKSLAVVCLVALLVPPAAWPQRAEAEKLPVRRVVLYKNGIGYFEHLGSVRGSADVTIQFTSAQLDDVLKSLTVLDLGDGRITGVSYNSEAPRSRQFGALRLALGENATLRQFLDALRGTRVELRGGATVLTGRLLGVERKTRAVAGGSGITVEIEELSVVTDAGEVRTVELTPQLALRIADRELAEDVGRYLALVAAAREQDLRRMRISTAGAGERRLYVSYVSEVPVWKTTYRIVLPAAGAENRRPLVQGWAIVDNTVGEDWEAVELALVAGAPQSFIHRLSQPYYTRRPVVEMSQAYHLSPQTHSAALIAGGARLYGEVVDPAGAYVANAAVRLLTEGGALVAETTTDDLGDYEFNGVAPGRYRVEFVMPGFNRNVITGVEIAAATERELDSRLEIGSITETVTVEASTTPLNTTSASVSARRGSGGGIVRGFDGTRIYSLELPVPAPPRAMPEAREVQDARARAEAEAQARELGDLFEYRLREPVTIRKNQSALVPIVHSPMDAEKVSLWSPATGSPRPLRALWLSNTSALTLDGGSFSVLEEETFAGEGLLETLRPGERRLLSYAVDLAVVARHQRETTPQRVARVRVARGVMVQTSEQRERSSYAFRNEDAQPRTIIVEHPARAGWQLRSGPKPEETTPGVHRFRVKIEPKQTAELAIEESRPVETRYEITSLTDDHLRLFLTQRSINAEIEAALAGILERKRAIATLDAQIAERDAEIEHIFEDQERLRENLKALGGRREERVLAERYTRQLDQQESRLETLRREGAALRRQRASAQEELSREIESLALESEL
jgi:hypothetical protein